MPKPISRREMIRRFRALGWEGPVSGRRHAAMRLGRHTVPIPNPHGGDLDWTLAKRILKLAGISESDWDSVA